MITPFIRESPLGSLPSVRSSSAGGGVMTGISGLGVGVAGAAGGVTAMAPAEDDHACDTGPVGRATTFGAGAGTVASVAGGWETGDSSGKAGSFPKSDSLDAAGCSARGAAASAAAGRLERSASQAPITAATTSPPSTVDPRPPARRRATGCGSAGSDAGTSG